MEILKDPLAYFNTCSPKQVISLVPSWTASLVDLGLEKFLLGISDYCPTLTGARAVVHRVGAPKTPDVAQILQLRPDLVIANQEENDRVSIEAIAAGGIPVWLTFPRTIKAMLADLWLASSLFRSEMAPYQLAILEKSVEWAEMALNNQDLVRYFCPIWEDSLDNGEPWWMTFNQETYSNDALRLVNGKNIFADRQRHYPLLAEFGLADSEDPGGRDTRYPRVSRAEITRLKPDVILLPDEPYAYSPENIQRFSEIFADTPAAASGKIICLAGSLIHHPGTILSKTLDELAGVLS
jgi:ABC-type Fe3+-hydroxamate transport system substrate-binding protein